MATATKVGFGGKINIGSDSSGVSSKVSLGASRKMVGGKIKVGATTVNGKSKIDVGFSTRGFGLGVNIGNDGFGGNIGIGILEVEYNTQGGGRVGWWFDNYSMKVSREGCFYLKDFYIAGVYTHTERQLISEDCLEEKDNKEKSDAPPPDPLDEDMGPDVEIGFDYFPPNKLVLAVMNWKSSLTSQALFWHLEAPYALIEETRIVQSVGIVEGDPNVDWPSILVKATGTQAIAGLDSYIPNENWGCWAIRSFSYARSEIYLLGDRDSTNTADSGTEETYSDSARNGRGSAPLEYWMGSQTAHSHFYAPICIFGLWPKIFSTIQELKSQSFQYSTTSEGIPLSSTFQVRLNGIQFYDGAPVPPRPKNPLPIMQCDCHQLNRKLDTLIKLVRENHTVLDSKNFIKKGVTIPKQLFIPGGRGEEKITNYTNFLATIVRIQAQSGIFPFTVEIEDTDLLQAGNQKGQVYCKTATEFAKAVLENTIDMETKQDAFLNIGVRIGIMLSKHSAKLAWLEKTIRAISDFLGYPRKEKVYREPVEFDVTLGARKKVGFRGFGPAPRNTNKKIEKEIKSIKSKLESGQKSVESALADFLQNDDVAIEYEDFDDESNAPDLMDLLDK